MKSLQKLTNNEISHTLRCSQCQYTKEYKKNESVISLTASIAESSTTLQSMLDQSNSHWQYHSDLVCTNCKTAATFLEKKQINSSSDILVLRLNIFDCINNKRMRKKTQHLIKTVPSTKLMHCGNTYKVMSCIFHSSTDALHEHYTALIRDQKTDWLQIDGTSINKVRWPVNSKNAYIFMLEKISKKQIDVNDQSYWFS